MRNKDIQFFTINQNPACLKALKFWLKNHRYNSWSELGEDKNGNEIIPIRWDSKPDSDWGKPQPATGIVVIKNPEFRDKVLEIIGGQRQK